MYSVKRLVKQTVKAVLPERVATRVWSQLQYRKYSINYPVGPRRPHRLPAELIVSLTSYPRRFPTLHLTLRSLLQQNEIPDRVILWLAAGDAAQLPKSTLDLTKRGLEIRTVPDVRSFKKLVYAIAEYPEAFIATADDDVFYAPDWLSELTAAQGGREGAITCHRAHRITTNDGQIECYERWASDVQDSAARQPSRDLVATGLGGVLYPPGSLHGDAIRQDLYQRYSPSADDLWFYWCARRVGSTYQKVGDEFPYLLWDSTQTSRLFDDNLTQNDRQIADLVSAFGDPLTMR